MTAPKVLFVFLALAGAWIVERHVTRWPSMTIEAERGDRVCVPDSSQSILESNLTLIVMSSSRCHYCGSPAEQRLLDLAATQGVPFIYVLATSTSEDGEARRLGSRGLQVLRVDFEQFGIVRTPTFLTVDKAWRVLARHIGELPPEKENQVLAQLLKGAPFDRYQRISRSDAQLMLAKNPSMSVLTLSPDRPVGRPGEYTFLPTEEIGLRATFELNTGSPIFVDCGTGSPSGCAFAIEELEKATKSEIFAIDLPRYVSRCDG